MNARKLGFVLGCLSIGPYAAMGGCSSSSSNTNANGGGDGGASSSGSSSGGVSTPYYGTIEAFMGSAAGKPTFFFINAGFDATPDSGTTAACAGTTSGNCCYTAVGGATGALSYPSAGTITVDDGATKIGTMVQTGIPLGAYNDSNQTDPTLKWASGDTLGFTAAGGTVNAFTGTVVAGGFMQNVNPALGATPVTVPKASDFTMTWTAGTTAGFLAYLAIDALKSGSPDGTITCFDKDSIGTITVPKALLANMTTGDNLTIALDRLNTNTVVTGNVTVTVDAFAETAGTGTLQ